MAILTRSLITILILSLSFVTNGKSYKRRPRVIHIDSEVNWTGPWYSSSIGARRSLESVVTGLSKSATGRMVIAKATKKAKTFGQGLYDILEVGVNSLTDTTLTRKFFPNKPFNIVYETRSKVFLNKSLSYKDAVLDLAHELTHYSYRDPFNPYVTQFTVDQFVSSVIEGRGGEVDAYIVECLVLKDLRPTNFRSRSNCQNIVDPFSGKLSKRIGVQKFYEVGRFTKSLKKVLNKYNWRESKFPKLGRGEALFLSAAYGVPYPVAAMLEFSTIMEKACLNDRNRLSVMRDSLGNGRGRQPASVGQNSFKILFSSYKTRCAQFSSN